jgi:Tol biopolymer transport system component
MPLAPGTQLGPYEITAALGAGGMGEVYRARDRRLERTVAIKVLPAQFSADVARKQRFEREAKTISQLNHPHICTLHDIGSQDGIEYLVMECVEGETLAKRLEKGPLPLEQVLKYGAQIADALDKAHHAGIVHRDLKPGNIMLTAAGAKLLDFGLAKPTAAASLATMTATKLESPVTQEGTIVGTFQYMSPEQVEGKEVDGRSDIFSLGAVLYEMVTGRKAFDGKSQLSVASAILEKEPEPIGAMKPLTPRGLDHVISKCLVKEPGKRWRSAGDVSSELQWVGESGSQVGVAAPIAESEQRRRTWLPWTLSGVLAAGLLVALFGWRGKYLQERPMYFSAPFNFPAQSMAIAPNGHTVVVAGEGESGRNSVLWLYELGSREVKALPDTDGATFPFWSADGMSIGFFASGKLKRLNPGGGPVQTLCDAPSGRGGTWNKDGVILFTPSGRLGEVLNRVSAAGGTPTPITTLDRKRGETSHRWPEFLPDGKHFLFMAFDVSGQTTTDAIFVGSLDSKEIKLLTPATSNASYAAPGYLVFSRAGTLFAQRFDVSKLAADGDPVPILTGIGYMARIAHSAFAVSGGLLLGQGGSGVPLSRLKLFDRNGKEVGSVGSAEEFANVSLSPDGKSVAVDKTDQVNQNTDIWIYDLQGPRVKRLTFDPSIDAAPMWSPDGKHLAFTSTRNQMFDIYIKPVDGSQDEKLVEGTRDVDKYPYAWSPDGKYFLYLRGTELRTELWTLSYPELKSQGFLKGGFALRSAQFSPDGKWVAYTSNETGKWEVYVTSFPEAKGKWQVSNGGGEQPRWKGDGKELYFLTADGKLSAAPVRAGAGFDVGMPVLLFQANARAPIATSEFSMYDVSKDGQRFLINTQVRSTDIQPISVVMNWDAELKKK